MKTSRPLAPDRSGAGFATGRHALGIDVGGTKIAGALVDLDTGTISARQQMPTDCRRGGEAVLRDVELMSRSLLAEADRRGITIDALGVGVPELVDLQGQVFSDYRIQWKGLDVRVRLSAILPTVVSSDVRAAAMAEAKFGVGQGLSDFYFVTIGTGTSGVLVINGVPYAGSRGAALVIGNGPTRHICPQCGHVATTIVEDVASGPGLVAAYGLGLTGEDVLAAALAGDTAARQVIEHATHELGRVLSLLVNSLDPAAVVIGGGLGSAPGLYFDSLVRHINAGLWDGDQHVLPIVQASFGRDAGIIGAAAAAISLLQEPVDRSYSAT